MLVRVKVKKPQAFRLRLEKNSPIDENDLFVFSGKRRDLLLLAFLLGLGSLHENFSASNGLGVSKRPSA
jgi:hypothetical protein